MKKLCFFLMLFFCQCSSRQPLPEVALKAYVMEPENGVRQVIRKNDTIIEMIYRPKDLVVNLNINGDQTRWHDEEKKLNGLDYFVLRLSRSGQEIENYYAGNESKFLQCTQYLSERIGPDLKLSVNGETISPEFTSFVPSFGTAGVSSVLIVFKSNLELQNGNVEITFDDKMFDTGYHLFSFDTDNIMAVPALLR